MYSYKKDIEIIGSRDDLEKFDVKYSAANAFRFILEDVIYKKLYGKAGTRS